MNLAKGKLLEIRFVAHYLKSGKVRTRAFNTSQQAFLFITPKMLGWVTQEKIFKNGFERIVL